MGHGARMDHEEETVQNITFSKRWLRTSITPFSFDGMAVRAVQVDGDTWFVAADVCAILDLGNVTMALKRLDPAASMTKAARDPASAWGALDGLLTKTSCPAFLER